MDKSHQTLLFSFIVTFFNILLLFSNVYAQIPVKLETDIDMQVIDIGGLTPQAVTITADATGQGLSFAWDIDGPGKLLKEPTHINRYTPPDSIDGTIAQTTITVTVTNDAGEKGSDSLKFILIPLSIKEQLSKLKVQLNNEEYKKLKKLEEAGLSVNDQIIPILNEIIIGLKETKGFYAKFSQEYPEVSQEVKRIQGEIDVFDAELNDRSFPPLEARDLAKNLIVQVTSKNTYGAGIIFSRNDEFLFIVTTNHIVRPIGGEVQALRVQFAFRLGEYIEAKLIRKYDKNLDVAVLRVNLQKSEIPKKLLDENLPLTQLNYVSKVTEAPIYPIAHPIGVDWYIPTRPANIYQIMEEKIRFEFYCEQGFSGGGVFDDQWRLIGMITQALGPLCEAISFERIHSTLDKWGFVSSITPSLIDEFRITQVLITDTQGDTITPTKSIYAIKVGEAVTIRIEFTNPDNHDIDVIWTAGYGKIPIISQRTTPHSAENRYIAERLGGDYVKVFLLNKNTGDRLERPISITVVP